MFEQHSFFDMLVFVGSNSSTSINKQLTQAVLRELDLKHHFIDLKSLDIPLFSEDLEKEIGSPPGIQFLKQEIEQHQHILMATNEHNQNMSAFFKNILDWLSRAEPNFFANKKVFILSASDGRRGALGANETLQKLVRRFGCEKYDWATFPLFKQNFDKENQQILNKDFLNEISVKLTTIFKN